MRALGSLVVVLLSLSVSAQRIDSIHVFRRIPDAAYTSATANALAWKLHREDATHRTLKGDELGTVEEVLAEYAPSRHTYAPLDGLTHVAIVFAGGRPLAFGVTEDLDLVINFTARTEYRISGWEQRLKVRALLARLLVD